MEIITTHKSVSGMREHKHFIFPDEPYIKSFAALVLIRNQYMLLDPEANPNKSWKIYMKRKKQVYKKHFAKYGKYICSYCKRDDLIVGASIRQSHPQKATIDHIIPVSRGGSFIDTNNMVVCCSKCNNDKDNSLI